jgi:transposase-like protein
MVSLQKFSNLIDLIGYFNNEQICRNYLENIRWNGKLVCPYSDCKHDQVYKYNDGKRYKCCKCKKQYSVKVGSIFEDSKIPLQKWFAAIYLITSHKKGISSLQLHRDIGVTQKTAWYMLHRVRHSLGIHASAIKLSGVVEADETFIGGKEAFKHESKKTPQSQGRSVKTKIPVAGAVERGGNVRATVVKNTKGSTLKKFVKNNIEKGSTLHTDEWYGYKGLHRLYEHFVINHNQKEYVNGHIHTNTIEGFWSLLKRGNEGIYHSMSAKHLQKYLDEFVFRYNTIDLSEVKRFDKMLNNITTTLPYNKLIQNEKRAEFNPDTDLANAYKWLEAKQGTIEFPNEN